MLRIAKRLPNLLRRAADIRVCTGDVGIIRVAYFASRGGKKDDGNLSSLFIPVPVQPTVDDIDVGAELTGTLNKADLLKVLNKFYQSKEIKILLEENGLDGKGCIY